MYEESLRMPFVLRYPREVAPGSTNEDIILNLDFAPLFLDLAGVEIPDDFQGRSFRDLCCGETPSDWREALYYRYWMHKADHNVYAHYGIRTKCYKLIYYYADALDQLGAIDETYEPEWELFDLQVDPYELDNVYHDPAYAQIAANLKKQLHDLQERVGDERYKLDVDD
jgi:arylsulfatase A-like enzyme